MTCDCCDERIPAETPGCRNQNMRLSPPPQVGAELHWVATSEGAFVPYVPHLDRCAVVAQAVQGHLSVSVSGSKSAPSCSVVWNSPRKWPVSCAAMKATSSGPQAPTSYPLVGQLVRPEKRSAIETTAPLWTVPLNEDGPGMVPSTPTTVPVPDEFVARRPCTRNRFIQLPGFADESVNIWFISSQGPVDVTLRLVPKRVRAASLTS